MQIKRALLLYLMSGGLIAVLPAQTATVGLISREAGIADGYVLFAPMSHRTTYLIDRQGHKVRTWESEFVPGLTAYLHTDGSLYRAGRVTDATYINSGGAGGVIERFDWAGHLTWQYTYSSKNVRQHHDFELMPNGNVLMIAWEAKSKEEAIAAGRDPNSMTGPQLWPEQIVEVAPDGFSGGEIVWSWHLWDHLIQDFDDTKSNFGPVAEHPQKVNLNYFENTITDWIHLNGIDYHKGLDQILLTSRSFDEIWIIDHSTTTAEAATDQGGRWGQGGDLLFRWGNPATHLGPSAGVELLFGPHSASWNSDGGQERDIVIFNNGTGRQPHNFTSIERISPLVDPLSGDYVLERDSTFLLGSAPVTFVPTDTNEIFAPLLSGVSVLPNEHLLLCVGPRGTFVEYNAAGMAVWKYINPVTENGTILRQGEVIGDIFSAINSVFDCTFYLSEFPGFDGRDLTTSGPIEGELVSTNGPGQQELLIYPNPTTEEVFLQIEKPLKHPIRLFDRTGQLLKIFAPQKRLWLGNLPPGTYFLQSRAFSTHKILISP